MDVHFNDELTIVLNSVDLALRMFPRSDPVYPHLIAIMRATERLGGGPGLLGHQDPSFSNRVKQYNP